MASRVVAFAAAGIMVFGGSAAFATDAQVPLTFKPQDRARIAVRAVPGRATDILGIRTGMSLEEVKRILVEHSSGREPEQQMKSLAARINGVPVKMEPFIQRLREEGDVQKPINEAIDASFSSHASGNKLISFDRMVSYRSGLNSPKFDDIKSSVLSKFGEPTAIRDNTVSYDMIYSYRNGKPARCDGSGKGAESCVTFARDAYQPENMKYHLEDLAAGDDFVLIVSTWRMANSDRVSSVSYLMSDYTARALASKADSEAMIESANQAQASFPNPPAPKL